MVVPAKPVAERKKREADPQLLLTHPYAYAHYVPTTYVAPTVFNHENHPSTVLTASGHHVYAGKQCICLHSEHEEYLERYSHAQSGDMHSPGVPPSSILRHK